jgi:hypothetical protein
MSKKKKEKLMRNRERNSQQVISSSTQFFVNTRGVGESKKLSHHGELFI